LPKLLLLFLEPVVRLLTFINVDKHHMPSDNMALGIARRAPPYEKPAIYAVGAA
jgi:hypothetical protein